MSRFSARSAIWSSVDLHGMGLEYAWFQDQSASGTILRTDERGSPFLVSYRFAWDERFALTEASIETAQGSERRRMELRYEQGWRDPKGELEGFAGCRDLDLWPTPLTNTFAIRRLNPAARQRQQIDVLWIEAPTLRFRREQQLYTRLDERRYRFESPASAFQAEIEVDPDGLVTLYPGLFRREL